MDDPTVQNLRIAIPSSFNSWPEVRFGLDRPASSPQGRNSFISSPAFLRCHPRRAAATDPSQNHPRIRTVPTLSSVVAGNGVRHGQRRLVKSSGVPPPCTVSIGLRTPPRSPCEVAVLRLGVASPPGSAGIGCSPSRPNSANFGSAVFRRFCRHQGCRREEEDEPERIRVVRSSVLAGAGSSRRKQNWFSRERKEKSRERGERDDQKEGGFPKRETCRAFQRERRACHV